MTNLSDLIHEKDFLSTISRIFIFSFALLSIRRWLKGPTKGTSNPKRLDGKIVVITGGNSGIGEETTKDLARRGAKVYILCRNVKQGKLVSDQIQTQYSSSPKPEVIELDLVSLDSIRSCANEIVSRLERIDYLINNAGVMLTGELKTQDRFDMQFGTNHLGHFLLTELLLPLVKKSSELGNEPRIINVSSKAHRYGLMNWTDLNFKEPGTFRNLWAYGQSKMANILHAKKLARDLHAYGIRVYSLHPGVIPSTNLMRSVAKNWWFIYYPVSLILKPITRFMMKNNLDGAQTTLYCVLEDSISSESGKYFSDCQVTKTYLDADSVEDQEKLDHLSRVFVGLNK